MTWGAEKTPQKVGTQGLRDPANQSGLCTKMGNPEKQRRVFFFFFFFA